MTYDETEEQQSDGIRRAAAAALADVNALAVQGDDRRIILKALLDARLGVSEPVPPGKHTSGQPANGHNLDLQVPAQGAVDDVIGKLSAGLKVDRDTLELVYAEQNGEPHLVISAKKLAQNKALAARQLGQLVAAARQVVGIEEWTSVSTIRKVVTDYGRLDSGNFAATIQQMDNVAVTRGKGQSREVKITKPGLEATADLIKDLAGVEG
jgi:hypothetical protein